MPTINETILDGSIRHMVFLERYKIGTVRKIIALLNKSDADLRDQLAARLSGITARGYKLSANETKRLEDLLSELTKLRSDMYSLADQETREQIKELAVYEADFQARIIESAVDVELTRPAASQVRAAALSRPFQGRLLREWYKGLEDKDAFRLRDAVKIGITQGQTTDQIVRRVVGTRANQYRDGILEVSRREAEAVVRTAIAHTANQASEDLYAANADIIKGVQWVSTLDSRTSDVCAANDGRIFPVNSGPRPPLHFNCRSRVVPYLGSTSIKGTRASQFGPVPDNITYGAWLKRQPVDVQNDVLGVKKAQLFRKGLDISRFVDNSGRSYTLKELEQRDAAIWQKTFS
jgi:SPP1 gp7 family putative phage head morphogenesis protein